jgi:hypothetical protein
MNPLSRTQENIRLHESNPFQGGAFFFLLAAYVVLGLFLLDIYRYHINTDVPTYIAIAEKYAAGHFHDAVTSLWSPLACWR